LNINNNLEPSDNIPQLPEFETSRLLLRGVTPLDVPSYEKYFVDYEVISHLSAAVPWPYPKNGVPDFLNQFIFPNQGKDQWLWGIFEKNNPHELIGVVHLWKEGRPEHRGFWLGKPFWGKGYMTEAVAPVMDYAFNKLGFEKLVFANAVGNEKSRRVKIKTGARLVDVRPAKFVNPAYKEHEVWELTKEEWQKAKQTGQNNDWPDHLTRFVAHYSTRTDKTQTKEIPSNFIKTIGSDFGRTVDFNRTAVHHVILPPGCRTSSPHAESLEEEFVYVIKGSPHLWLNGYIHDLSDGFAVGFPAGTGIAHTLINNTESDVHLIVAGDKTKKENLCSFPINPELKHDCQIWWDNPPAHPLGPHNGLPGPIKDSERALESSPYIVDCNSQGRRKPFHYPGDNETFGEGFRVTDKVGLKNLGIWYDYLPPGKRTAFPHAHTHEEEFVFVLKGHPTVWLDGYIKKIGPGDFAAFPSNTGLAHTLMNETSEEVLYLCIGETQDFPSEKISYPLNPLRKKECQRKGWYWDDLKSNISGTHSAYPKNQVGSDHINFQICSEQDADKVLEIFKSSPTYFQRVDGCLPSLSTVKHAIVDGPTKQSESHFKEFLIINHNSKPIGVVDVHANHPEKEICYLGLLLISESLFARGLGRTCYELAEDYILRALGCKKIRIGISNDNDVSGFWEKMGFKFNGKTYDWKGEQKTTSVREFDKVLTVHG
jgi:[ribosomal protein S5]-alanine N-acetyltransferase